MDPCEEEYFPLDIRNPAVIPGEDRCEFGTPKSRTSRFGGSNTSAGGSGCLRIYKLYQIISVNFLALSPEPRKKPWLVRVILRDYYPTQLYSGIIS